MSEVVVSTRVRLARNLSDYPFPVRMTQSHKAEVVEKVCDALKDFDFERVDMDTLDNNTAVSMVEKHLISPQYVGAPKGKVVLLSRDKTISIMINEEDHLRIQVIKKGLDLKSAYDTANEIDDALSKKLSFAYSKELGYLTQCPTNLGTGMRASVMLHLPALSKSNTVSRLANNLSKLGLTIRGMYGESTEPVASMYQLSNQVSLGISETAAIDNLQNISNQLVTQEVKARDRIMTDISVRDTICRSLGILKNALLIDHTEAMTLLSNIRLGVAHKELSSLSLDGIDELLSDIGPASVMQRSGEQLTPQQRDINRATYIREKLN